MAKNERLILKAPANELYKNTELKISSTNIGSSLTPSFTAKDIALLASRGLLNEIAAFYGRDLSLMNPTTKNRETMITNLNVIRNLLVTNSDVSIAGSSSPLLEKIPVHKHINETEDNLIRMASTSEYGTSSTLGSKIANLKFIRENFFDSGYAVKMFNLGRATEVFPDINNRLYSTDQLNISGYIKVEDASPSIQLDLVIRGVPVRMRKTETSYNSDETRNYIFTYPQYLINTAESIRSIQYIDVINRGAGAKIFYGTEHYFPVLASEGNYVNLKIFNKIDRNQ